MQTYLIGCGETRIDRFSSNPGCGETAAATARTESEAAAWIVAP